MTSDTKAHILVVDDESNIVEVIRSALQRKGTR